MSLNTVIEISAVICGLIYVILMIRENIWCWPFGILGSLISIFLFIETKLYSEAILYTYYVVIGIYGWYIWRKPGKPLKVSDWGLKPNALVLLVGISGSLSLGSFFHHFSDADKPFADAATTVFSFLASFMEARKVLSSWLYWIVINAGTILLYYTKSLDYYAGLTLIYLVFSFTGYISWRKKLTKG